MHLFPAYFEETHAGPGVSEAIFRLRLDGGKKCFIAETGASLRLLWAGAGTSCGAARDHRDPPHSGPAHKQIKSSHSQDFHIQNLLLLLIRCENIFFTI